MFEVINLLVCLTLFFITQLLFFSMDMYVAVFGLNLLTCSSLRFGHISIYIHSLLMSQFFLSKLFSVSDSVHHIKFGFSIHKFKNLFFIYGRPHPQHNQNIWSKNKITISNYSKKVLKKDYFKTKTKSSRAMETVSQLLFHFNKGITVHIFFGPTTKCLASRKCLYMQ